MPKKKQGDGGFYVEFVSVGGSVKVTAIDPVTGIEVSMIGAPQVTQDALAKLAVRKLKYVLAKGHNPPLADDENQP